MEYFQNTLCITGAEILEFMPEGTLKSFSYRKKVNRVRRGCFETPALYSVDSLPEKYKVEVYKKYPDLKKQAEAKPLLDNIEPDGEAINFFETYQLPDGRHLDDEKKQEYTNNAAILNCCKRILEAEASHRGRQGKRLKKGEFWKKAAEALPRLDERYPNSLPQNPLRLQEKYRQYQQGGYEILINGRFMNKHAAKVDDDIKESVLLQLIGDRRNLDNEQIRGLYNYMAEQMKWEKITAATVGVWREKYDLITSAGRLGETSFRNNRTMQVKRSRPTLPLLYWTADGWDVELLFQRTTTDKKGHSVTTYHNRLTVVIILDPCVNYPVGYAIGEGENPGLIKAALRNAVNHTRELFGERYRVNQFQCDNYAIKTMTPLYGVIADKVTPARVRNAKSKVIEPYFKRINKKYCQLMPNWSGFGITSNKNSQPNIDAMNKYRHSFPDLEGCTAQITWIVEQERAAKREKYLELFTQLPDNRKLPLSQEQYLLNFGADTGFTNALEGSGLKPTINGIKRSYDCFTPEFRMYSHLKWVVKYDPDNLNEILAVSEDGSLRFMLEEKYVQPMALAERKEGDSEQLQRVRNFNKTLETGVIERLAIAGQHTKELLDANPQIDTTLSRLILCDSDGQHKNQRNKQRKPIDVKAIDVTTVGGKPKNEIEDTELGDLY